MRQHSRKEHPVWPAWQQESDSVAGQVSWAVQCSTGPFCNLVFLANLRHENLGHWQIVAAVSTPMDLLPCPFNISGHPVRRHIQAADDGAATG